jgi:hypothetical protein
MPISLDVRIKVPTYALNSIPSLEFLEFFSVDNSKKSVIDTKVILQLDYTAVKTRSMNVFGAASCMPVGVRQKALAVH